jgi:hypothetical protein
VIARPSSIPAHVVIGMARFRSRSLLRVLAIALLSVALGGVLSRPANAVTPESPEVKVVLDKAFKWLETADDGRLGGKCLIGLAFLKNGADEQHPKVDAAVKACKAVASGEPGAINADLYSTGIAIIFLCELNPSKYGPEILKLRDSLIARQKPHGGWGYAERETGDTSMTQYGVLAYWEIQKVGLGLDIPSTEKVANWIIRTQDPGGNWGYQGKEADPPTEEEGNKKPKLELVKQDSQRQSMTAAGLGCTFMVADLLKLSELSSERDAKLPPAVRAAKKGGAQAALTDKVELRHIRAAQERGRSWMGKNYKIDQGYFQYYYLYALERYQSFLEASDGRYTKEPRWYNEGFAYLKKEQLDDGHWKDPKHEGTEAADTAFGCLFLLRSTKKAIEKSKVYDEASLVAGRGLPVNSQDVAIRGGRIVQTKVNITAAQLVEILHQPDHRAFSTVAGDTELLRERLAAMNATDQAPLLTRLRGLALTGVADGRLAAVKVLGQIRDLGAAETLIAALDDADWRVVLAADESLRTIGRVVSPSGLSETPNKAVRADAIQSWKRWLLTIRPDAEFLN